jgi:putative transcriptional regulator
MDVQAMITAIEEVGRHIRGEVQLETVEIIPSPVHVARLRNSLGLSQTEFSKRFGVRLESLQHWESGTARPNFYEETLLWHIEQNPEYVAQEFEEYCRSQPLQKGGDRPA